MNQKENKLQETESNVDNQEALTNDGKSNDEGVVIFIITLM